MKTDEIKDFLVNQVKFIKKRAETEDERVNLDWWIEQLNELDKRAPRAASGQSNGDTPEQATGPDKQD